MKKLNISFLKSFSVYTISNMLTSGVAFILLPILTSFLTPSEYGKYSLFLILFVTSFNLIGVSSHGSIQVEYYQLDKSQFAIYTSSALFFNFINFLALMAVVLLFNVSISNWMGIPAGWLWIVPIVGFSQIVLQSVLVIFQSSNKPLLYGLFNSLFVLINIGFSLTTVICFKLGWIGVILSTTTAYGIILIFCLRKLNRMQLLVPAISTYYILSVLRFGLPLLPHAFSGLCIELGNRIFIAKLLNLSEVGIYNAGNQVAKVINLLEISFVQAFTPFQFEKLKENNSRADVKIVKLSYLFMLGLALGVVLLWFASPLIFRLFIGSGFQGAIRFVPIISVGYLFSGIYKIFTNYIFYYKKTVYLTYIACINIAASVAFNYYFIKNYGAMGAAYASVLSYFLLCILTIFIAGRIRKMPWLSIKPQNDFQRIKEN